MIFSGLKIRQQLFALVLVIAAVVAISSVAAPQKASAAYNGGRIIDNTVFLHANSMNASQIQSFLASKGSGLASKSFVMQCSAAGATANQLYVNAGAPCGQNTSAANIIYFASRIYGVNPQVILATIQKEQSLVTTANPTVWQITQAMGYACPTTGSCDTSSNFFYQIDNGTWVLRFHYERANGNNNWWYSSGWVCGTEKNFYKPNLYPRQNVRFYDGNNVLYRTHYIENAATSSFYCYTPHAYNNPQGLYGRAPYGTTGQYYSGSYNFVTAFEAWFGSTQSIGGTAVVNKYTALGGASSWLGAATGEIKTAGKGGLYQQFANGKIYWHQNTGAWTVRSGAVNTYYSLVGYENGHLGYPRSDERVIPGKGIYQLFEGGQIYWSTDTGAWGVRYGAMFNRFIELNYESGYLGLPTSGEVGAKDGTYQTFQGGRLYWRPGYKTAMDMPNKLIGTYTTAGTENGYLGLPNRSAVCGIKNGGCWMNFDGGKIYWHQDIGGFDIRYGDMQTKYAELGYENGHLGYPISREIITGNTCEGKIDVKQIFQGGTLYWSGCSHPRVKAEIN